MFQVWSFPQINLFAAAHNAVCPRYFTIARNDLSVISHDALHQKWGFKLMYAFPPPHLIQQTLGKLAEITGTLIRITLCWQDAAWWGKMIALSLCQLVLVPLLPLQQQHTKELHNLQLTAWLLCPMDHFIRSLSGGDQIHFQIHPGILSQNQSLSMEVLVFLVSVQSVRPTFALGSNIRQLSLVPFFAA